MGKVILRNLVKTYPEKRGGGVTAVKGVDLSIADGEFVVLVGPSGCGKSTTLRMVAGLEEISEGSVAIDDRVVNDVAPKDRDIAMVFQNYALYPHMSVYENMAFGLKLRRLPKSEIHRRVNDAAAMLGLEDFLDRKPKALSGGQRQRVALGRAIVRQPKVFLFDEPLSNLDAKMRVSTRTEIAKLHDRLKTTMIYVTHDQVEAMTLGDRICVMKDGRIMQVASPMELYNRPANMFVAGFIGSPPMNLIEGQVRRNRAGGIEFIENQDGTGTLRLMIEGELAHPGPLLLGKPVVLGVRPEHIRVVGSTDIEAVELVLELAEPMGAETYLHATTGMHRVIARVDPETVFEAGQSVRFRVDVSRVHLFDRATGDAVIA